MRSLFVTVDPAYPPISGAELRSWQNAAAAAALGEVVLASLVAPEAQPQPPGARLRCVALAHATERDIYSVRAGAAPLEVNIPAEATARFGGLLRDWRPDRVVIESLPLHPLLGPARKQRVRTILDLHNVESALLDRMSGGGTPLRRWRRNAGSDAARLASIERAAAMQADRVWVCSAVDAVRLARLAPGTAAIIVPNGIPRAESVPPALLPRRARAAGELALLFAGHLGYAPNRMAADWLAREIMPALRRRLPGARAVVAGRSPPPAMLALARPGILEIVADPPAMDALLTAADVAVLPLRAGGGTRIKALEAMAWGLPLVATALAVEGLGVVPGVHYQRAETAADFAEAIAALAEDAAAAEAQRGAARGHALANFGPAAIADAVRLALADEAAPARAGAP